MLNSRPAWLESLQAGVNRGVNSSWCIHGLDRRHNLASHSKLCAEYAIGQVVFFQPNGKWFAEYRGQAGKGDRTMSDSTFKLGDRVVVSAGAHAGHEGYIVRIACDGPDPQPDSLTVRLYDGSAVDIVVAPDEIRKAVSS
jgi:hypothetical protein